MSVIITPEKLARSGTESGHQLALCCWAAMNVGKWPELRYLFAIPNGGSRHIAEATKLAAMGVKRGVPDLMLPVKRANWSGLFLELKRPTTNTKKAGIVSVDQEKWIEFLLQQNYRVDVVYGWEQARDCLLHYLELK